MHATKLQLKLFATGDHGSLTTEAFIPVFHRWIKDHLLQELVIDVANYAHVPKGPGVVLIGHNSDYFVEEGDGRFGLLHSRKRGSIAPEARLEDLFRRALHAGLLLQKEPSVGGKLVFSANELLFRINDRLAAPSNDETFGALRPELEAFARRIFQGPFELTRVGDGRALFAVRLTSTERGLNLATLLARAGGPPASDLP